MKPSHIISGAAIAFSLFHLYTGGAGQLPNIIQRAIHVGFALIICFAIYPPSKKLKNRLSVPWYDLISIFLVGFSSFYVVFYYARIMSVDFVPNQLDIILGIILTVLVLEASRRVIGLFFPMIAVFSLIYAYFGPYFPDIWQHRGVSLETISEVLYLTDRGLWGLVTGLSATVIATFIIFGSFLLFTGGGSTFVDLAVWVSGRAYGGAAKVATVASGLFGTISGSAAANVATTGTFTIPLMKKLGYRPEFAGGVEATASTGGQLMPPIMGAGAFIMAELLQIPYVEVAIAGAGPAILFYIGVYYAIHLEAKRVGLIPVPEDQIPRARTFLTWSKAAPVFIPLAVLMIYLLQGYTPMTCGFWATIAGIILFLGSRLKDLKQRTRTLFQALEGGGKGLVMVAILIACAQIVLAMISTTGLGVKFSSLLMSMGEEKVWLALFFAMVITIILGMGLPTSAAYILAAAVVAPALIRLGINPRVAHFFIFYYACAAGLTPPVCPTVFIGASMAQADWLKTAWVSLRLGLVAFIVPYMMVQNAGLLFVGTFENIVYAMGTAIVGIIAMAAGSMGYFFGPASILERILFFGGGLMLFTPGYRTDILGLVILGTAIVMNKFRSKRKSG